MGPAAKRRKARLLARFHRKADQLGIPPRERQRMIQMADKAGEDLRAPDWYAGRCLRASEKETK